MNIFRKYQFYRYFNNFVRYNNQDVVTIRYNEYIRMIRKLKKSVLIDVRNPQEYYEGHLSGAINIPVYDINKAANIVLKDKTEYIFLYCKSGSRSRKAAKILISLGYINVYNLIDVI